MKTFLLTSALCKKYRRHKGFTHHLVRGPSVSGAWIPGRHNIVQVYFLNEFQFAEFNFQKGRSIIDIFAFNALKSNLKIAP